MINISFEEPEIRQEPDLPLPIEGQSYPYNQIANPRRFEELIYSIFREKISIGDFENFDTISLMSGVRDKGRDCALFIEGKAHGLIQCKQYKENYTKEDFGLEITKFALYSLLHERLIHSKESFTYFIVASSGFSGECSDFIDDFSGNIINEPRLDRWVTKNLAAPTLAPLRLQERTEEVRSILSSIKVRKFIPADLDTFLSDEKISMLTPLFFGIRTVTDNSKVEALLKALKPELSSSDILSQLSRGSVGLNVERNEFEGIPGSHIVREETGELLQWILADSQRDEHGKPLNICLLAGQAGHGKTIILKDLYDDVCKLNIPVLGLKVDKLYHYTILDLQDNLGLSLPIYDFFEACGKHFPLTVVLVDQIDALSQSMSSDRRYLNVYKSLIDNLAKKENIKIVISVRTSDLNYDPSLRVYNGVKTVKTKILNEAQVLEQLAKIGILPHQIPKKLLELLRTPSHFNVFSRIALNSKNSFQATSVQDLYFELWATKVTHISKGIPVEPTRVKQLLYKVSEKMFELQRIVVSEYPFEDFAPELRYLESELILTNEAKQLQFFHQSFYDFVFAKEFVENGKDLVKYIIEAEQSIQIRSAVKMMLGYLRDYDHHQYIETIEGILWNKEIFFHIKHVALSIIHSQEVPTDQEIRTVLKSFQHSMLFANLFFEQAWAKVWFDVSREHSLLNALRIIDPSLLFDTWGHASEQDIGYLRHICLAFVRRFLDEGDDRDVWEFVRTIEDQSIWENVLYSARKWAEPIQYEIFNLCTDFESRDPFAYYHVLSNIAKANPEFALERLEILLPQHYGSAKRKREYDEREVLKELASSVPEKLFPILFRIIEADIENGNEQDEYLTRDYRFRTVDLVHDEHLEGSEFLYKLLAQCLRLAAERKAHSFSSFYKANRVSKLDSVLRLLIYSLNGNEKMYSDEIYKLSKWFIETRQDMIDSRVSYELRVVLGKAIPYFAKDQASSMAEVIMCIVVPNEVYYSTHSDPNMSRIRSCWGLTKYQWLMRLPLDFINGDISIKRHFLELKRRFPRYQDIGRSSSGMAGYISSPVPDSAHKRMKNRDWIRAFRKYHKDRDRYGDSFLKGGIDDLASAFHSFVKDEPVVEKLDIIKNCIGDPTVDIIYPIVGLKGWTAAANPDLELATPLFKQLLGLSTETYISDMISIASNLVGVNSDSEDVVKFITEVALRYDEQYSKVNFSDDGRTSIRGLITTGVNTPYGAAIRALMHVTNPELKDLVFSTVERVMRLGPSEARASAVFNFAYLMNLDRDRAFEIFAAWANRETDIQVIASAIWSLQYMGRYNFETLKPVYDKLVISDIIGDEDSHSLFVILYEAYMHNLQGADSLLYILLDNNKQSCLRAVNEVIKYYYLFPDGKSKNDKVLDYVLTKALDEDYEKFSWNFLNADHIKLNDIYQFLKKYINSPYFSVNEYFINYLTLQCRQSPLIAIELFDLAMQRKDINAKQKFYRDVSDATIKFIVGAFKTVNNRDEKSKMARAKLLKSFDVVLTDYHFKNDAEKILEDVM
ncbi:hypothetical protein [Dyadobacter sp. CY347]|uniref:hypothetical protein n=1 Tax=Dyadobacter sp. CY347 TaxID=2909336 RepID=UPI001F31E1E2|nr:hypothetical protein [Dyadobacter sp. CY347]MCF2489927.1 hypothetical protein [Dyadobacter sp. CY347]